MLFFLCLFSICCENEKLTNETVSSQSYEDEVILKDGRLFFTSKQSLTRVYQKYLDVPEDKIIDFLNGYYKNNFHSLRPIVNESNEALLYEFYRDKIISTQLKISTSKVDDYDTLDYLDDIEDVIGDDTFASFLNSNGEIQVASDIYKYTDVGLFIVNIDHYNVLINYLLSQNISTDWIIPTPDFVKNKIYQLFPNEGISEVNEYITYFKVQESIDNNYFTTSKVIGSSFLSKIESDPSYNSFFSSLNTCDPHSGIFGNLFGDNDVCIDKYESRRRVKTKAFNYNYLLVYHLGVKCVNQYRGWTGFWRVDATDEIRLVVEAAQFEYDADALLGNDAVNNLTRQRAYFMNNQRAYFVGPNTINFIDEWGQPFVTYVNQTSLPKVFQDDLTFEFFGTGNSLLDSQIQNGIDSNLKATNLNKLFYNELYSQVKTQLQNAFGSSTLPPSNRTFLAKYPENGKMIIQKSINSQGFNIGVREKTFDWGVNLCFQGGGSDWQIKPNLGCNIIVKPKNFRVKIIGAVRHGNNWHGSKFTDGID